MASRESKHTATESGFLNNVYVLSCFETRHKYSHLSRCPGESTLCCAKSLHHIQFFETLWTIACLAPVSMGSSRQEYWSGVAMPSSRGSAQPGDWTQVSHIAGGFFTIWAIKEDPGISILHAKLGNRRECSINTLPHWPWKCDVQWEKFVTKDHTFHSFINVKFPEKANLQRGKVDQWLREEGMERGCEWLLGFFEGR